MSINIENALKIDGWMRPEELTWLATQAKSRNVIAEVGSWMGRSTRALVDNTSGVVYAVDTWLGTPGPKECARFLEGKSEDWLFEQFHTNMGKELFYGVKWHDKQGTEHDYKLRPQRSTSLEGADYLGNGCYNLRFDMIFLDAAHDEESVTADILAWQPLLAPGGLLCGHDFGASFVGVERAVRKLLPGAGKVGAGSIWAAPVK